MNKEDIVIHKVYCDNLKKEHINLGAHSVWHTDFKLNIDDWKYKGTHLLTLVVDVYAENGHTKASLSTYTEFIIAYDNLDKVKFYASEIAVLVELFGIAYSHARVLFSEQNIGDFATVYLPFMFITDIKSKMAISDLYNKL